MPLYEYQCDSCGRFEVIQKFAEGPLKVCPTCKRHVQKLPSAPAIQFKGTGWYVTDYARKGSKESSKEGSQEGSKESKAGDASTGTAKTPEKPAAATTSGDTASGGTPSNTK